MQRRNLSLEQQYSRQTRAEADTLIGDIGFISAHFVASDPRLEGLKPPPLQSPATKVGGVAVGTSLPKSPT